MSNSTPKKGLSPLAWIAIGCGALALVFVVVSVALLGFGFFKAKQMVKEIEANPAKATAEMMVKLNPELELVDSDDDAGTMTIKNVKTGETLTVDFEDVADGKISFSTKEGEMSIDASEGQEGGGVTFTGPDGEVRLGGSLEKVPDWVPLYPGSSEGGGTYTSESEEEVTGLVVMKTSDDAATVLAYYEQHLAAEGYEIVQRSSTAAGEGTFATLQAEKADPGRTLIVSIVEQDGETQVNVNYTEKTS